MDASRVLTAQLSLPENKYPTPEQRSAFYQRLDSRLSAVPGISLATVASSRPFVGAATRQLSLVWRSTADAGKLPSVSTVAAGPRYFDALGLRLLLGRAFTDRDGTPGHEVAIVNQRFAETYYPNVDVVGQRIQLLENIADAATASSLVIVGVSPTVRQSVASAARPVVYVPLRSHGSADAAIMIGGLLDPLAVTSLLRAELASLDADVTLFNVRPLENLLADSRLQHRLLGTVLGVFAGIALLLSMIGLYAVTAYAVLQRTHEIGVRIALGARSQQVVWLFVRRGLMPLASGLLIGLVGGVRRR